LAESAEKLADFADRISAQTAMLQEEDLCMFTVFVTYTGTPQQRFDMEYYANTHLPLSLQLLGRHGLLSASAFQPVGTDAAIRALCTLTFANKDAFERSMCAPEMALLIDDLKNFTELLPVQHVSDNQDSEAL